jgi:hypothetical protein
MVIKLLEVAVVAAVATAVIISLPDIKRYWEITQM